MRRFVAFALTMVTCAACAIPEPPPGGPEDRTPPKVIATVPAHESTGVSVNATFEFTFSEPMASSRIERTAEFSPAVKIRQTDWSKDGVRLVLDEPLNPDTTYVVRLRPGFRDRHGVENKQGYEFAFATSAHLDSGQVSGTVFFKREASEFGVIRLFVLPQDSGFAPEAGRPDRETRSEKDGTYALKYLANEGGTYVVWAFHDANKNGSFDPSSDFRAESADTVTLTEGTPQHFTDFYIIDPNEPAAVSGVVSNESGFDSIRIAIAAHEVTDSLPPTVYKLSDLAGNFKMNLKPGRYVMFAFADFRKDSVCGGYPCADDSTQTCAEPCVQFPDTVVAKPGGELVLPPVVLPPPN